MDNICRTCLKVGDNLKNIFEDVLLPYKINVISSVEVSIDDNLPSTICDSCTRNVHLLYDFRNIIILSNSTLIKRQINAQNEFFDPDGEFVQKLEIKEEPDETLDVYNDDRIELITYDDDDSFNGPTELDKPYVKNAMRRAALRRVSNHRSSESRNKVRNKRPVPPAVCNVCGVTMRSDNLKKHILNHSHEPVNCKVCGKTCKNPESLRGHMIMHKGIVYKCKICGKVYKHRGGLAAHRRRHEAGDAKTVPCSICGKLFFDKQVLQKHIRSHTGERPYPCKYCKRGFSSIYARNTHTRQHTNDRPYACQFCSAAFHQKVSLKTHLQSKHPDEEDALNSL